MSRPIIPPECWDPELVDVLARRKLARSVFELRVLAAGLRWVLDGSVPGTRVLPADGAFERRVAAAGIRAVLECSIFDS